MSVAGLEPDQGCRGGLWESTSDPHVGEAGSSDNSGLFGLQDGSGSVPARPCGNGNINVMIGWAEAFDDMLNERSEGAAQRGDGGDLPHQTATPPLSPALQRGSESPAGSSQKAALMLQFIITSNIILTCELWEQ